MLQLTFISGSVSQPYHRHTFGSELFTGSCISINGVLYSALSSKCPPIFFDCVCRAFLILGWHTSNHVHFIRPLHQRIQTLRSRYPVWLCNVDTVSFFFLFSFFFFLCFFLLFFFLEEENRLL